MLCILNRCLLCLKWGVPFCDRPFQPNTTRFSALSFSF
uniref:Uncharacterized protein n=1 Tax=Anguilla anguilla TaxID=7936 RepID=A0A0E9VTL1_ANGAN